MNKCALLISLLFMVYCLLIGNCYAEEAVSSAELINNSKEYDGKIVVYKGEAIGDIMIRKGFAWVNVNDSLNAIGIWSDKNLAKGIICTGAYKSTGDIVEARGVFHRACLEHGGDLDIHAEDLRIIEKGAIVTESIGIAKVKAAVALAGALFILLLAGFIKNKFRRIK